MEIRPSGRPSKPIFPGREQQTIILQKLYAHVAQTVTAPLREDPTLTLDELLQREQVVCPVMLFMVDLRLLPGATRAAENPTLISAVCHTLSPLDRSLLEMFSAKAMKKPSAGRPRKTNPFGRIPAEFQPATREEKLAAIRGAFAEEGVLLPPSECTVNALLKLKELTYTVKVESIDDEYMYTNWDAEDVDAIKRLAEALLMTSEVVVQLQRVRVWLIDRLMDCSINWSIINWLIDWLIDCMIFQWDEWLINWLFKRPIVLN